ncbi:UNKNOWN [Stylonychia lemnae]|uniref:Transmembrane protein n=1 Tax=Stylonychia lemnae TaxID=5949 RepID=A0A078AKF4_STYLE|nr:UNKNOWN [Stylonychia lemnae]|eukprot:CDW81897.1 UNKNOWN [Stylonychia lemnae]
MFISFLSYVIALSCINHISFSRAFLAVVTFNCKQPKRTDLGCCGREKQGKQTQETKNQEIIENQINSQEIDSYQKVAQLDDQNIQVQGVYRGQAAGGYPPMTTDFQQQNLQPIVSNNQIQPIAYGGFLEQQEMIQHQSLPIKKVSNYKVQNKHALRLDIANASRIAISLWWILNTSTGNRLLVVTNTSRISYVTATLI